MLEDGGRKYVAKFPSSSDRFNVVKAEYVAMRLAGIAGLNVAPVRLVRSLDRDVLLVEPFDREAVEGGWRRRALVSALTLLGLDEMMAAYASYESFAETVRVRFDSPRLALRELFSRMTFNILSGDTDDHARNHAAFWDGILPSHSMSVAHWIASGWPLDIRWLPRFADGALISVHLTPRSGAVPTEQDRPSLSSALLSFIRLESAGGILLGSLACAVAAAVVLGATVPRNREPHA